MVSLRSLYNQVWLLIWQYRESRRRHPGLGRLELLRAGLEALDESDEQIQRRERVRQAVALSNYFGSKLTASREQDP